MKYNEEQLKQLITQVKEYQQKLQNYNHDDVKKFNKTLNITIVHVILSVLYNNHLPATLFMDSSMAKKYAIAVLGEEVIDLVGFTEEEWLRWFNKAITRNQKFPFNIINKIKRWMSRQMSPRKR